MIDIKRRITKSYDETKINKLLYDGLPWHKRIDTWLFTGTAILGLTSVLLTRSLKYATSYRIIFYAIMFFGLLVLLNREYKRRLRKKNIKVEKSKFNWVNEEYEIKKQETFYKELLDNGVLTNGKYDIDLMKEYEHMYIDDSNFFKNNINYLYGGGAILLFIIPVWTQIISQLFKEMQEGEFEETMKLIIALIAMIYMMMYLIYSLNSAFVDFTNSMSKKQKEVSRMLRLVRLNLMIKYSKKDYAERKKTKW